MFWGEKTSYIFYFAKRPGLNHFNKRPKLGIKLLTQRSIPVRGSTRTNKFQ